MASLSTPYDESRYENAQDVFHDTMKHDFTYEQLRKTPELECVGCGRLPGDASKPCSVCPVSS